jgi:hypothetical protein
MGKKGGRIRQRQEKNDLREQLKVWEMIEESSAGRKYTTKG